MPLEGHTSLVHAVTITPPHLIANTLGPFPLWTRTWGLIPIDIHIDPSQSGSRRGLEHINYSVS